MIRFSIIMAVLLVSVGLYGSNMNQIYAQNNALSQSGNSEAEQAIEQAQSSSQDAQCVSGDITALSCNNVGLQVQSNTDEEEPGTEPPCKGTDCPPEPCKGTDCPPEPPLTFPREICHNNGNQEETMIANNQADYDAHVGNAGQPGHLLDHDGECATDPE
jgi:hypothetical protein